MQPGCWSGAGASSPRAQCAERGWALPHMDTALRLLLSAPSPPLPSPCKLTTAPLPSLRHHCCYEAHEVTTMLLVTFMLLDLGLEVNYCYHPDCQCAKGWREGSGHMGSPPGMAVWAPFPATNRKV